MSQQPFSSDNGFSTTGNITAGYLFGNGVSITGVTATANTGNVTFSDQIVIGTGISNLVSGLYLSPSSSSANAVQYLRVRGDVSYEPTHIHFDTGNNQYFNQFIGDDNKYVLLSNSGNIVVNTDDYVGNSAQWNFGTNGNLSLPRGGIVYETNIPFGGFNGNTIALKPSGGTNADQQLLVYPTANTIDANHLHLTSGNLYNTELFLGSDDLYVKLANTGNVVINSNNGNGNVGTWTFGTDSALTLPASSGQIGRSGYPNGIDLYNNNGGTGYVRMNYADESLVWADSGGAHVQSTGGTWDFDTTGNLTFPSGNLVINSDSTTFSNAAVISSADHNLITLSTGVNGGLSSLWVEDYANIGTSNIAAVYANPTPGSKIVRIAVGQNGSPGPYLWDFDGTGNATFPSGGTTNLHDVVSVGLATFSNVQIGGNLNYAESANLIVVEDKDGFADIIAQNKNSGGNASMNIVLVNDDPGNVYMAVGVNSSNFTPLYNTLFEIPDAGYVSHSTTQVMGPQSSESGESRMFLTYSSGSYALELNDHGAIGWGATYDGNLTQGNFGNAGQVLTSAGENSAPTWSNFSTIANGTSNVTIPTANGNVTITSNGGNTWTFDNTGNLTIPGNSGGLIKTVANAAIGITAMNNGTDNPAQLMSWRTTENNPDTIVSTYANSATVMTNVTGTLNTWTFDNAGNLTLPSDGYLRVARGIISTGASPAPSLSGFSSVSAINLSASGNVIGGNVSVTGNVYATNIVGEASFSIQTANFSANIGARYGVNTTSNTVTATLPATPTTGGAIFFADAGGAYDTNNLIINPNGQTIMGVSGNMTVSTNNQSVGLFYNGTTWRTYNAG